MLVRLNLYEVSLLKRALLSLSLEALSKQSFQLNHSVVLEMKVKGIDEDGVKVEYCTTTKENDKVTNLRDQLEYPPDYKPSLLLSSK